MISHSPYPTPHPSSVAAIQLLGHLQEEPEFTKVTQSSQRSEFTRVRLEDLRLNCLLRVLPIRLIRGVLIFYNKGLKR